MISIPRAHELARAWVDTQGDFPPYAFCQVRGYDTERKGRLVTVSVHVRFTNKGVIKHFFLAHLLVLDTESIQIPRYRVGHVRQLIGGSPHEFITPTQAHSLKATAGM